LLQKKTFIIRLMDDSLACILISTPTFLIIIILSITISMEQSSSWEASRYSANQEILHILWNPKVHDSFHKCQPSVLIRNQINPVNARNVNSWRLFLILSSHLSTGLPPKPHIHLPVSYMCHMPSPFLLVFSCIYIFKHAWW